MQPPQTDSLPGEARPLRVDSLGGGVFAAECPLQEGQTAVVTVRARQQPGGRHGGGAHAGGDGAPPGRDGAPTGRDGAPPSPGQGAERRREAVRQGAKLRAKGEGLFLSGEARAKPLLGGGDGAPAAADGSAGFFGGGEAMAAAAPEALHFSHTLRIVNGPAPRLLL